MMGDKEIPKKQGSNKKKKKRGGSKRRMTSEQTLAYNCVSEWVFLDRSPLSPAAEDFAVPQPKEKLVFELHSHSIHSDGFLSPFKLVERAHQNGVSSLFPPLANSFVFVGWCLCIYAFLYIVFYLLELEIDDMKFQVVSLSLGFILQEQEKHLQIYWLS